MTRIYHGGGRSRSGRARWLQNHDGSPMQTVMRVTDGLAAAQAGIARGFAMSQDAATRLAEQPDPEAVVDLARASTQVEASVASVRAIDESLGTLIDALA